MSGPGEPAPAPRTFTTRPDGVLVWRREDYELSTDRGRLDLGVIHRFLAESYWAAGATPERIQQSIDHSIPLGLHGPGGAQVGFARIVTDRTTFAWLADVFVLDANASLDATTPPTVASSKNGGSSGSIWPFAASVSVRVRKFIPASTLTVRSFGS